MCEANASSSNASSPWWCADVTSNRLLPRQLVNRRFCVVSTSYHLFSIVNGCHSITSIVTCHYKTLFVHVGVLYSCTLANKITVKNIDNSHTHTHTRSHAWTEVGPALQPWRWSFHSQWSPWRRGWHHPSSWNGKKVSTKPRKYAQLWSSKPLPPPFNIML